MYLVCSIVMIFKNQTKCLEVFLENKCLRRHLPLRINLSFVDTSNLKTLALGRHQPFKPFKQTFHSYRLALSIDLPFRYLPLKVLVFPTDLAFVNFQVCLSGYLVSSKGKCLVYEGQKQSKWQVSSKTLALQRHFGTLCLIFKSHHNGANKVHNPYKVSSNQSRSLRKASD